MLLDCQALLANLVRRVEPWAHAEPWALTLRRPAGETRDGTKTMALNMVRQGSGFKSYNQCGMDTTVSKQYVYANNIG